MSKREEDKDGERKENLWDEILSEVSSQKIQEPKHLIVFGNNGCGKSSLINCLRNPRKKETKTQEQLALSYDYINITEEESEDLIGRLGVWQFEGNEKYGELLHFALKKNTVEHSMILIALDFTSPWEFLRILQKWTNILEKCLNTLELSNFEQDELKDKIKSYFQSYKEPTNEEEESTRSTVSNEANTILPLGDGVLTKNLGIPIIVTCLKADAMNGLEKELGYKEKEFDFIQQHLRKFCLRYGAALCYVSVKENTNTDLLTKYITHRLYGNGFKEKPEVFVREKVFVPSGWDSLQKINVLNSASDSTQNESGDIEEEIKLYEQTIVHPSVQKIIDFKKEIIAEDEQEFLQKQNDILTKSGHQSTMDQNNIASKVSTPDKVKSATTKVKKEIKTDSPKQEPNTEILQNFFQNLIKKNPSGKSGTKSNEESPRE